MAKESNPLKIVRDYAKNLKKSIEIDKIILFGSASRNQMTYDSDIDVIVLSPDFENVDFIKRLQLLSHSRQNQARKVPMDILGYTQEEFAKLANESVVLAEAQKKGKVVNLK